MYSREIYLASKFLGCVRGAIYGKPAGQIDPLTFSPSELPRSFQPNPEPTVLLQQFQEILGNSAAKDVDSDKLKLPWSFRRVDLQRLFCSLVTFSDDHQVKIAREYFPIQESLDYIEAVRNLSEANERPLLLLEQFSVALGVTDSQVLPAAILCHSASRAIGRNRDRRVSSNFRFDEEDFYSWGNYIARFDSPNQYDPAGDTYHFWATFTMGLALRLNSRYDRTHCLVYGALFYFGADIMRNARQIIARNPLHYKHREVDRLGLEIGWNLLTPNHLAVRTS